MAEVKKEIARRWRWLGVEFVVIALGVLAALFVDTWVEDRENAERAEVYRQRLIIDIERDIRNLDAVIEYYNGIRDYALMLLADLEGEQPLDDFTLLYAAFNAAEEWRFILESSTYNDLQSTGGLALIDDVSLRIDLADYHRIGKTREVAWNLSRDYREVARGIIPNTLQTAIHTSCNSNLNSTRFSPAEASSNSHFPVSIEPLTGSATSEGLCGLNPGDFFLDKAAAELRSDPRIPHLLRYRISQLRVAAALFDGQRQLAERLLERLR